MRPGVRAVVTPSQTATVIAPAKLTVSLRVVGRRPDGYHLLDADMVSVDLADTLHFAPGDGLTVVDRVVGGRGVADVPVGADNLVARALALMGRRASVTLVKRIPAGAGLGGGSSDAAAVLRWCGCGDPRVAVALGADVPFCVTGGRARVRGVGEEVEPVAPDSTPPVYVLLLPPLSVDTAAVYRAFDTLDRSVRRSADPTCGNDLEAAAVLVEPELARWRDALSEACGRRAQLAGSGSTWFVEGDRTSLGLGGVSEIRVSSTAAPLIEVTAVPGGAAPSER